MPKQEERAGTIYKTTNYNRFKILQGNRDVTEARVAKILRSVDRVGYIPEPIIVNEKMEVIDGQGRLEVARRLGEPVHYTIIKGLGFKHCVEANNVRTGWKTTDYIHGYAEQGNDNYRWLAQIFTAYRNKLPSGAILVAASPDHAVNSQRETIRTGGYKCNEEQYMKAVKVAEFFVRCKPYVEKMDGRKDRVYNGLKFMLNSKDVDNEKMLDRLAKHWSDALPINTVRGAVEELQKMYNYRNTKKAFVMGDYDKAVAMQETRA